MQASVEFKECYSAVVAHWRSKEPSEIAMRYQGAFAKLFSLIPMDWHLVRCPWLNRCVLAQMWGCLYGVSCHAPCVCAVQFVKSFDDDGVAAKSRSVRLLLDALNDLFGFQITEQRARMLVQVC